MILIKLKVTILCLAGHGVHIAAALKINGHRSRIDEMKGDIVLNDLTKVMSQINPTSVYVFF